MRRLLGTLQIDRQQNLAVPVLSEDTTRLPHWVIAKHDRDRSCKCSRPSQIEISLCPLFSFFLFESDTLCGRRQKQWRLSDPVRVLRYTEPSYFSLIMAK